MPASLFRFLGLSQALRNLVTISRAFNDTRPAISLRPTIYALSSGYGKCGVAVIRVSGPRAIEALLRLGGFKKTPEERKTYLRKLRDPESQEVLDHGLVVWFPGPRSFTGEDSCELHVHGGSAVVTSVLGALAKIEYFQPAEPGEFTRRAFYSGKLNLTEVEGLGDLIHSETEEQRKQALYQMEGALGEIYHQWRVILLECLAHVEAVIDFGEDQHLDDEAFANVKAKVARLTEDIKKHLEDGRKGERLRGGVRAVILGAPNVGKSSLMNALCKENTAIVAPIPGTTRDVIRSSIDINGYPVHLSDTAGLRSNSNDIIEIEGIQRAQTAASESDLVILVIDAKQFSSWTKRAADPTSNMLLNYIKEYLSSLGDSLHLNGNRIKIGSKETPCLLVMNKIDLLDSAEKEVILSSESSTVSCKTEEGMVAFIDNLTLYLKLLCGTPNREHPNLSQARHRYCIVESLKCLDRFSNSNENEIDLAAHELRQALHSLAKVTGQVSVEEVLDVIFKEFCIGK